MLSLHPALRGDLLVVVTKVVDLLVAMCRAALESPRKSIIFEPYPSVVDPNDPKTLAFNPKVSAGGARAQWGWEAMATPLMVTSLLPHVEEELRAAAEGSGQRDVHPGDDPGIPGGSTPGPFARGGILVPIATRPRLGGCRGTHLHPLSPLPGLLPGDQEADGQAGPSGPSPPAVVRPRVLRPPRSVLCPHVLHSQYNPFGPSWFLTGRQDHAPAVERVLVQLLAWAHSRETRRPPCLIFLLSSSSSQG